MMVAGLMRTDTVQRNGLILEWPASGRWSGIDDSMGRYLNTSSCAVHFEQSGAKCLVQKLLRSKSETSDAVELPGNFTRAHYTHHLTTNLAFDGRAPRHEAQAQPVVDHGKAATRELG
jgi:hypothetical protein